VRSEGASASRPTSEGARSSRLASDVADRNAAGLESAEPAARELVRLRDGSSVSVRAASARDEPALLSFLSGLCVEARRLRFFTGAADIAYAAHMAAAADARRYGLIAHDEAGVTVGHATYAKLDDERAEVAVEVADHLHGRGLGTILIERLAQGAQARGITTFVAEVLPENRAMLDVFRDGFDAHVHFHDGTDTAEFPTAAWRLARERFEQTQKPKRAQRRAAAAAVVSPAGRS
jgi:L-amino acid N-acyltransferase YncA